MKSGVLCLLLVTGLCVRAHAITIAEWTFETSQPNASNNASITGVVPENGSGVASGVHASATTDWTSPVGNGSEQSFSANTWSPHDYFQFNFSTTGYTGVRISFDQTSSGTGPKDFMFQYRTDGTAFTDFADYAVLQNGSPNPAWSGSVAWSQFRYSFDLTAVAAVENAAQVYVRLRNVSSTSANGGTVGSQGTSRVDNFLVVGSAIAGGSQPVPDSGAGMVALSSVLLVLTAVAHRRSSARAGRCV